MFPPKSPTAACIIASLQTAAMRWVARGDHWVCRVFESTEVPFSQAWKAGGGGFVARLCTHATRQSFDLGSWF